MTRKRNTNFRLGLDRKQLIEAAIIYGKSEKSAKKSNTANLEKFITTKILGKGSKIPELSVADKRDVKENAQAWGVKDGLKRLTYRAEKLSGLRNETNFLTLTVTDGLSLFYDGTLTREIIDEMISILEQAGTTKVNSDLINISPHYREMYIDFVDELIERDEKKKS